MIPALTIVPKRDINGPGSRDYSSRDTIYVSPTGKDGYLGYTPDLPTKTLDSVKTITQQLKQGPSKDLKVEFLGGKYTARDFFFKDDKFTYFKHYENGDDNYSLTFKPYSNQYVEFDNSTSYTGFVSAGSLWKIKINESDIRKCNMFGFVNGIRSVPARFPKYGNLTNFTLVTYGGVQYIKVPDSTGFLKSIQSYLTAGNSYLKLGGFYTVGYTSFGQTNLISVTAQPPGATFEENMFYIRAANMSSNASLQFYANQSTIYQGEYKSYSEFNTNVLNYQLTGAPDYITNVLQISVEEYVQLLETDGIQNDVYFYDNSILTSDDLYYLTNTSLESTFTTYPPQYVWIEPPYKLNPIYYEPTNLDPYIVCSVKSENTIIFENNEYWFYYKPSSYDESVGIENSILTTYDTGARSQWFTSDNVAIYGSKTENGYNYNEGKSYYETPTVGFNIISPKNTNIFNLNFKHCLVPITLNNPTSSTSINPVSIPSYLNEYTGNLSITGCNMYYNFGSAVIGSNLKDTSFTKNLIYNSECNGLYIQCGRDLIIENNIVKTTHHIDSRINGEGGYGIGNIRVIGKYINNAHDSRTLTGVKICNNDFSYAGANLITGAMRSVSAFNNKIQYAGFGANDDMGAMYDGYSFHGGVDSIRNKYYNNFINYARASTNSSFLGNLLYLDGTTNGPQVYNNIFANGQTGIQHTSINSPYIYNNIIYNTRVSGIVNKSNSGNLPIDVKFTNNIFVPGSGYDNNISYAFYGWNGNSVNSRTISTQPYNCDYTYGSSSVISLVPISPWKGKIRYSAISGGGVYTISIEAPMVLFDGSNWIVGNYAPNSVGPSFIDGIYLTLSSTGTGSYENPWDIPNDRWVYVRGGNFYNNFTGITRSTTRRSNTASPALSSDNNLFWSLASPVANPEITNTFFKYSHFSGTSFKEISSIAAIPDPIKINDNSVPSVFGDVQILEKNSKLSDPLFTDPVNLDFTLLPGSPAYDIGFQDIDMSNLGVYNTSDDPYWTLSAANLIGQPVINGNKYWADYTTIPYPYNHLVEYNAPQVN